LEEKGVVSQTVSGSLAREEKRSRKTEKEKIVYVKKVKKIKRG
jgi:hypothetical protein